MKFRIIPVGGQMAWGPDDVAKADTLGKFMDWKLSQPFEHEHIFMLFSSLLSFIEVQERVIRYLTEDRPI